MSAANSSMEKWFSIRDDDNTLRWRHNDHAGVSNHEPYGCLLNRLLRHRSKKTSKLRVTGLCVGNSPGPVNSPHKGPVTRKMFPFDDVIMKKSVINRLGISPGGHICGVGSQITSNSTVCPTACSGSHTYHQSKRNHQITALLTLCGNPLWPVDPLTKGR